MYVTNGSGATPRYALRLIDSLSAVIRAPKSRADGKRVANVREDAVREDVICRQMQERRGVLYIGERKPRENASRTTSR